MSDLPASQSEDLGPRRNDEPACDKPVRAVVGSLIWLGGMTRPDIANAVRAVARQAHDPAEKHWRAVRKIIAYLSKTKYLGLVFVKDGDRKLSVYVDADYANKDNDRRSVSGVTVMVGGTVVNASSTTQHCATLSTSEAEYVAMAQGGKTAYSQRLCWVSCTQNLPVRLLTCLKTTKEQSRQQKTQSTVGGRNTLAYVIILSGSWLNIRSLTSSTRSLATNMQTF